MKLQKNFIFATICLVTILFGLGTTGRLASAFESPGCLPASGERVTSATFTICVENDQQSVGLVNLHRITNEWDEGTVTWNSFNDSYHPDVEGLLNPSGIGCYDINITHLVQEWVDGTYENFGMLLKVTVQDDSVLYWSKDSADSNLHPELEVCFAKSGCITLQNPADAHILSNYPDVNYWGFGETLYTRLRNDYEKQSLVSFETCPWTLTPGYWKNHLLAIEDSDCEEAGNQSLLPVRVCGVNLEQTAAGSPHSTTEAMSVATGGWRTQLQLARQCTAAALNIEAGGGFDLGDKFDECCGDGGVCGDVGATRSDIGPCVNLINFFNNSGDRVMDAPFEGCYNGNSREARTAKNNGITIFSSTP